MRGFLIFGRDRDRTDDLLVANEALSQTELHARKFDILIIAYRKNKSKLQLTKSHGHLDLKALGSKYSCFKTTIFAILRERRKLI